MTKPRLILINGFAASGKTTIAQMYINNHSLALALEADVLVDHIGDWVNHRKEVLHLTFELTKAMLRTYLTEGHDVVLPYLVTKPDEVAAFEEIARMCGADFYEFLLHNERPDAIARLLKRGRWGEATSPPLTEDDMPEIEDIINRMEAALEQRPNAIRIDLLDQTPEQTYQAILQRL